jgi:NADH dehydrogenase [ubiquinone] 1 alpha subcomplex assembly factor 5
MAELSITHPFDRILHARRRARAAANFASFDFLQSRARDEILERLGNINRRFPLALDLGAAELRHEKISTTISADLAPRMLASSGDPRLVLDEEFLPFAPASFDLITAVLQLHWVNDLPGALVQMRQALKPDGLFIAAMLGGDTLTELRQALTEAELEIEGGASPHVSPFADLRDLGSLLQRAGFALPVVDADRLTVRYKNMFSLMADLRGMGETNALNERRKSPLRRATFLQAAELYQKNFQLQDGRIPATFEIFYLTGWAPHASQQKPLRPGSATHRLADALHSEEQPAGDKVPRS